MLNFDYLRRLDVQPQIPSHFPNDNTKRIDYVITYKYEHKLLDQDEANLNVTQRKQRTRLMEKENIRVKFLEKLREEQFEIDVVKFEFNHEIHNYVLLHCKIDRLFEEAERVKLEMRLNNVYPGTRK